MVDAGRHITIELDSSGLRERNKTLAMLVETASELAQCASLPEIHEKALDQFIEHLGVDAGRLYTFDPDGRSLTLAASKGIDPKGLESIELGEGFTSMCVASRTIVAKPITDLSDSERVALLLDKGFRSVICLPLLVQGEVIGVINLTYRKEKRLSLDVLDMMMVFSNRVAIHCAKALLVDQLREQAKELEEQKRAIQFFSYTAFHDLKSPAVGLLALTKRLRTKFSEGLGEKGSEYCRQIEQAAIRVESLVRELNQYMNARESSLEFEDLDLNELLEELRQNYALRLNEQAVTLNVQPGLPKLKGHRLGVLRLFQNLVDNALVHGGKQLSNIRVSTRTQGGETVFTVYNDGERIPDEECKKIFEPFKRSANAETPEGTGLGLAIVSEIVQRHGGCVWVEAPEEGGVSFCFTLAPGGGPQGDAEPQA